MKKHFNYKHGYTDAKIYQVWSSMKKRCYNPNNTYYKYYGARGIKVCDEWLDAKTFCDWAMANGYKEGLSIDRIDNDDNYHPKNVRFVSQKDNNRNRSITKLTSKRVAYIKFLLNNTKYPQKEIAKIFGVAESHISSIKSGKKWADTIALLSM